MASQTPLVEALFEAARQEDWGTVDDQYLPQFAELEENEASQAAKALLTKVEDSDPNIRDGVATAMVALKISDRAILKETVEAMFKMVSTDPERYPAGRAAAFLLSRQDDEEFGEKIKMTLTEFKAKAQSQGWVEDLKENIPSLASFFG